MQEIEKKQLNQLDTIRSLRDDTCKNKDELKLWIKYFLNIDLPDCTVDPDSNCNPLEMVWLVYKNMIWYNDLKPEEKMTKFLFYAARAAFKTYNAAIIELLALMHDKRGVVHIAAGEDQAKRCYIDYFLPAIKRNPLIKEVVKGESTLEKTEINGETIEHMPCTKKKVQGPHKPFVCLAGNTQVLISYIRKKKRIIELRTLEEIEKLIINNKLETLTYNLKKKRFEVDPILEINKSKKRVYRLRTEDNEVMITLDHKIYVKNKGYKQTKDLRKGDILYDRELDEEKKEFFIKETKYLYKKREDVRDVYDINVEGNHNFFANNLLVHNCRDEIDVVQDISAYNDISGIPINTPDGKPAINMGISVRKSAFGLVQKEIDEAKEKGTNVFHWNILDITEKCPEYRSGTNKVNIYVKNNSLIAISEDQFRSISIKDKVNYEKYEGFQGCLENCKLFACCKTYLKNQKSDSKWLKPIDYTQNKIFGAEDEDMAMSQFLCWKPSTKALVFPDWDERKNVKTYSQMYEIFTGLKVEKEYKLSDLLEVFYHAGVYPYIGIDFGFVNPTVALLIFIDSKENIYVVKEFSATYMHDGEFADYMDKNWAKFKPIMIYPDTENPSGIEQLRQKGFVCAGSARASKGAKDGRKENVIKDVKPGISTIRRFIRVPGTLETKFFVAEEDCPLLKVEMPVYHFKANAANIILNEEEPVKERDHAISAIRYTIHSLLGRRQADLGFEAPNDSLRTGKFQKAPTPEEVGAMLGIGVFHDEEKYKEELNKKKKEKEEEDDDFKFFSFG